MIFLEIHQVFLRKIASKYAKSAAKFAYVEILNRLLIKSYYGDAEYIKIPQIISGNDVICVQYGVNWGENAKAIKFPDGFICPENDFVLGLVEPAIGTAKNVVSISLPDSMRYIKGVDMPSLEAISLPKSLSYIGTDAFKCCYALKDIDFPLGLEKIGHAAFQGCTSLEKITLPSGLKEIGSYAFAYCLALKKAEIPDSVTKIEQGAFEGCEGMEISYKGNTYTEKNIAKLYGKDLSTM